MDSGKSLSGGMKTGEVPLLLWKLACKDEKVRDNTTAGE
jgi:hypothetical protein